MSSTSTSVPFPSRRNLSLSLAAAVALVLGAPGVQAASLTWDADTSTPGVQDGIGIWSTAGTHWWDGTTNVPWGTGTIHSVTFGGGLSGTADIITLGSDITVGNITFLAPSSGTATYKITGSNTLTLSNTTISGTAGATIEASLGGTTGLTITNTSTAGIILSGTNTYSGVTKIGSGSGASLLRINNVDALGIGTQIDVSNSSSLQLGTNAVFGTGKTISIVGNGVSNFGALQAAANTSSTWAGTLKLNSIGARVGTQSGGTLTLSGQIQNGTQSGLTISAAGGGTSTGVVIISGTQNNYTGATSIVRGILKLGAHDALPTGTTLDVDSDAAADDSTFDLNGFNQTVGALKRTNANGGGAGKSFITNTGSATATLTVNQSSTTTYDGIIKDGGAGKVLALAKSNSGTLTLTGANTYTGTTTVNGGTLQLGGAAGALASTDIRLNGGTFTVDNTGTASNNNNRLANGANFTLNTGTFIYKGSDLAATNSAETVGSIILNGGLSTLSVQRGDTNTAILTASGLTRITGGGIAFANGDKLGSSASTDAARLMLTAVPSLTGNGSTATNKGIVPYLLGEADGTTGIGTATGTPNTFLTYDSATGLRPLDPTDEFASTVVTGANVRITADAANTSTDTVNSLILAAPTDKTFTINSGQTLTNTSGAVLFTGSNTINGGTLNFGDAEGIVTVNSGKTGIIGMTKITGSNGLSFFSNGTGTLGLGSNASTYTGETTLHSGVIVPQVSSLSSGGTLTSGPFGLSTVVFAGSQIRPGSGATAPITIGNTVRIQADTTLAASGGNDLIFSGPVTLQGTRTLTNSTTKNTLFSGVVGGGQGDGLTLAGAGTGSVILSGNNSYTGPTTVRSSTLDVSGSISSSSALKVQNSGSFILSGNNPAGLDRIGNNTPVTLGGGTGNDAKFKVDNTTASAPFEESVGTLTLLSTSILDLGTGGSGTHLSFTDSSSSAWSGTLSIYNWTGTIGSGGGTDQLRFGLNQNGLTSAQLSQIIFYSDAGTTSLGGGMLLSDGELVPVPEPSTILGGVAMLGLIGWRERRRFSRKVAVES